MTSTQNQLGSALKTFAKISGSAILQMILFTIVGIFLNLLLFPFMWYEISGLIPEGGNPGARAGGPVVILVALMYIWPVLLFVAVFLVLFPVIFFFAGKKQAIKAAVSKLVNEKGDAMVGFIVSKFTERMATNPQWQESIKQHGITVTVRKFMPGFIKTLQGLPWILKRPLRNVFEAADFASAVEDAYKNRPDFPINSPETNAHITTVIASKLREKFQPPKGRLLLVMVIINVAIFVLVKVFL